MKISRRDDVVVLDDGAGAHYGLGVLVPALVGGMLAILILPPADGIRRFDIGMLAFAVVALALAVLNPPRIAEIDPMRREVRLKIGWPPILGRHKTIPFDTISDIKVSQFIHLDDNVGAARPILVLKNGRKIYLSTYKRSPTRCRELIEQIRPLLVAGSGST